MIKVITLALGGSPTFVVVRTCCLAQTFCGRVVDKMGRDVRNIYSRRAKFAQSLRLDGVLDLRIINVRHGIMGGP